MRWRRAALLLLPFLMGAGGDNAVLRFHVRYEDRPYDQLGFGATRLLPVRYAAVEVSHDAAPRSWVARTDRNGDVQIVVPKKYSGSFIVWVYSCARVGRYDVLVSAGDGVAAEKFLYPNEPTGDHEITIEVKPYTNHPDPAWPFNVLDTAVNGIEYAAAIDPTVQSLAGRERLDLVMGRCPSGSPACYGGGTIVVSAPRVWIDDSILHEVGHWAQDVFGQTFSGEQHTGLELLHPDVAFGEGWAHYFSCATRRWLKDPRAEFRIGGQPGLYGQELDVERAMIGRDLAPLTQASEMAVAAALWDAIDDRSAGESYDSLNNLDSKVWQAMVGMSTKNPSFPGESNSLDTWFRRFAAKNMGDAQSLAGRPSLTGDVDSPLKAVGIRFYSDGPFVGDGNDCGTAPRRMYQEPNETADHAWGLGHGTDVGPGLPIPIFTLWDRPDQVDQDWFWINVPRYGVYRVTLTRPSGNTVAATNPQSTFMDDGVGLRLELRSYEGDATPIVSDPSAGDRAPSAEISAGADTCGFLVRVSRSMNDPGVGTAGYYGLRVDELP